MNRIVILILLAFVGCTKNYTSDPLERLAKENNLIALGEIKNVEVTETGEATDSTQTLMPVIAGTIELDAEEVFKGPQERDVSVSFMVAGSAPVEAGKKVIIFAKSSADKPELTATVDVAGNAKARLWDGTNDASQGLDISFTECVMKIRKYVTAGAKNEKK